MAQPFWSHLRQYTKDQWTWLSEPKTAWRVLGVLVFAFIAMRYVPYPLERNVRWTGLALQLLGLSTAMYGLVGRGKLFNAPHPIAFTRDWFKRRRRWSPPAQVMAAGTGSFAVAGGSSIARGRAGIAPNAPIEEQVAVLKQHIDWLFDKELPAIRNEQAQSEQRLTERMDTQAASTSRQISEVQTRLKGAVAGDVTLEWAGVVLLVFGLILGTASPEIADWFGK